MDWKWSVGEPCQKSQRKKACATVIPAQIKVKPTEDAYANSLHHDENTWDLMNPVQHFVEEDFKVNNKREQLDEKIAERYLIQQRGSNPYMTNDNYAKDFCVSDQFLKPINTTQNTHP